MATTKILGMQCTQTLTSNTSPFVGTLTRNMYCPNWQYYENGVTTLDKSIYISGLLDNTAVSLVGLQNYELIIDTRLMVLVFDGEPEELDIRVRMIRLGKAGSIVSETEHITIGSAYFPMISDNEVNISSLAHATFNSTEYSANDFFGYFRFEFVDYNDESIVYAIIGH